MALPVRFVPGKAPRSKVVKGFPPSSGVRGVFHPESLTKWDRPSICWRRLRPCRGPKFRPTESWIAWNLSPALLGTGKSPRTDFFYWNRGVLHAVRSGPWKLHFLQNDPINYGKVFTLEKPELYNLEKDISEAYEVADTHPDIVEHLIQKAEMHKLHTADSLPDQLEARIGS